MDCGLCPWLQTRALQISVSDKGARSIFCSNVSRSFTPVSDKEILNPLGFPGRQEHLWRNEVTLGGRLDNFRTGAGHQEDEALVGSLELPSPLPILQAGERDQKLSY